MTEAMPFLRKLITFLWPPVILAAVLLCVSYRSDFAFYRLSAMCRATYTPLALAWDRE